MKQSGESVNKLGKLCWQVFKFGVVGLINTAITLAVYYVFVRIDPSLYLVGNAVGFFAGTLNAYFMNHRYVFGKKDAAVIEKKVLLKTYLAYGFSLCVSTGLLYLLVNCLHVSAGLAPVGCLCITVPLNYIVNKFWVYRA